MIHHRHNTLLTFDYMLYNEKSPLYVGPSLVFSHLGFWNGNLFLIAPFPDLCLLVLFSLYYENFHSMMSKKVQVGKDQEKAQSEKDSHSKNQGGKKTN